MFDRGESFVCRHIGPNDAEQLQMLNELGYQVRIPIVRYKH